MNADDCQKWGEWVGLVDQRRTAAISVAIDRVLLASTERRDHSDALLDAVIAWENLVGTDEGETTFRITTSLSWLLAADGPGRDALEDRLRALYRLRSRIVHGNPGINQGEVATKSQEAIDVTLAALRNLFLDRPELLQVNSRVRSRRLILDA